MDSRFRAFVTNLEKTPTAKTYSTSFYQHTLCDFEHISELYSTHFIKGRYFASVLLSCVTSHVSSVEKTPHNNVMKSN